jgi:kynurenine formamidase
MHARGWDPKAEPKYRDLPEIPGGGARHAWGVFGEGDQVGTVNRATPERTAAAARLVRTGRTFALSGPLEEPDPPLFERHAMRHSIERGDWWTDDVYDGFYTQASSQWDALCHISHPDLGFYGGARHEDVTGLPGSRDGIDHWAQRGIAGRWILADVARYRAAVGSPVDPGITTAIPIGEVEEALDWAGVSTAPGDVLLIRFGWLGWYRTADTATRVALAEAGEYPHAIGLLAAEETAEWLWDRGLAAVASDSPGLEALPHGETVETFLHMRLIPLLGFAVGEMFDLDALAADCAGDGVYKGLFASAPLNKLGGSGSPANALALK